MNFFEQQKQAKIRTRLLFVAFPVALVLVAVFFHLLIMGGIMLAQYSEGTYEGTILFNLVENPEAPAVFLGSLICVSLIVTLGSVYRSVQLARGGGERAAELLNGREISPYTQRFEERQLMNVVEEMAIASGVLVPGVFVLPKEFRINAFSAGFHKDSSVIGVSAGALEYLNREELQALVAHEFSHILNGDTRMNSIMIGVLYGFDMITQLGIAIAAGCVKVENHKGELEYQYVGGFLHPFLVVLGSVIVIIGLIGTLMGALIKSAISRQREFLADASAVQFTRNPNALKNVMIKIGCPRVTSLIYSAHALEMSHIFFASVFGRNSSWFNFLSSHPNLTRRIRRLDSQFDGTYPKFVRRVKLYGRKALAAISAPSTGMIDEILKTKGNPRHGRFISRRRAAIKDGIVDQRAVLAALATDMNPVLPENLDEIKPLGNAAFPSMLADATPPESLKTRNESKNVSARSLITGMSIDELLDDTEETSEQENESMEEQPCSRIPGPIRLAWETPEGSCCLFLALLLDLEKKARETLFQRLLENGFEKEQLKAVQDMLEILKPIRISNKNSQKLSDDYVELRNETLKLGMAQIRQLSPREYRKFRNQVAHIQLFHRKVDLFRYTFYAIVRNELDIHFGLSKQERIPARYHSFNAIKESIQLSLSYLAYAGHDTVEDARHAFDSAFSLFSWSDAMLPISQCTFRDLDSSLKKLRYSSGSIKEKCLLAFWTCICDDGQVTPREEEIYYAAIAMLGLQKHANV